MELFYKVESDSSEAACKIYVIRCICIYLVATS